MLNQIADEHDVGDLAGAQWLFVTERHMEALG